MIIGAHLVCYSPDAEADRRCIRELLGFRHVDAGQGWLIFALPPTELAFHPGDAQDGCELYLLCEDLDATMARLGERGAKFAEPVEARWGRVTRLGLPSGARVGLYQPYHPLALPRPAEDHQPEPGPGSGA